MAYDVKFTVPNNQRNVKSFKTVSGIVIQICPVALPGIILLLFWSVFVRGDWFDFDSSLDQDHNQTDHSANEQI